MYLIFLYNLTSYVITDIKKGVNTNPLYKISEVIKNEQSTLINIIYDAFEKYINKSGFVPPKAPFNDIIGKEFKIIKYYDKETIYNNLLNITLNYYYIDKNIIKWIIKNYDNIRYYHIDTSKFDLLTEKWFNWN